MKNAMKNLRIVLWSLFLIPGFVAVSSAHTPFMACFDNGDGTITCNGEFSDGSSAAEVAMRIIDGQGKILMQGRMNEDSEYTFKRPKGVFTVIFDAGPGHVVKEKSDNITE